MEDKKPRAETKPKKRAAKKAPRAAAAAKRARSRQAGGSPLEELRAQKKADGEGQAGAPEGLTEAQIKRREQLVAKLETAGYEGGGTPYQKAVGMAAQWQQGRLERVIGEDGVKAFGLEWSEAEIETGGDALELIMLEAGPQYAQAAPAVSGAIVLLLSFGSREVALRRALKMQEEMRAAAQAGQIG